MKANSLLFLMLLLLTCQSVFSQAKPKTQPTKGTTSTTKKVEPAVTEAPKEEVIKPIVAPAGKEVVAVYPFTTTRAYDYDYAVNSGTAVEAGFVRSTRFVVVERSKFGQIKEEDKFKEANTSEIVQKALRFGAKTVVTGQIVGVSKGNMVTSDGRPTLDKFAEISISFKIIDVQSGEIKLSEIIRGKGEDGTEAGALQEAYQAIDKLVRSYIAVYLPQRFKLMSVVQKLEKKKGTYLQKFKIWGGSDNGLKVEDVVELYQITVITNPNTGEKVEEKSLLAQAKITEVNSGSTATCEIIDAAKKSTQLLTLAESNPEKIIAEYKGNWHETRTFWDMIKE